MTKPRLLSIVEVGFLPDMTALYQRCGYEVDTLSSMRRALRYLKTEQPQVIVCEFIFLPTYSMRISNLEPMFAALELSASNAALIILAQEEQRHQLARLDLARWRHSIVSPAMPEVELQSVLEAWRDHYLSINAGA